jgi:hypothetical protein
MTMRKITTFNVGNATKENSRVVLWAFGLAEGIVMIMQSAEWLNDYIWWPRILPIIAFALSHTKILFKEEVVDANHETTLKSDSPIEITEPK